MPKSPTSRPGGDLPPEVHHAGTVLIVQMLNNGATTFKLDIKDTRYEGKDMGDFEISVRRTRDPS